MSFNATINFTISKAKGVRPAAGHESTAGQMLKMSEAMSDTLPLRENYVLLVVKAFADHMSKAEKAELSKELVNALK